MDYADVPAFIADLREREAMAALAYGILDSDSGAVGRSLRRAVARACARSARKP